MSATLLFAMLCLYKYQLQWRSQDIADARAQHGHTTFLYKLLREVQKHLGGLGHKLFTISQPPRSVLKLYHLYGKLVYGERTRLVLLTS